MIKETTNIALKLMIYIHFILESKWSIKASSQSRITIRQSFIIITEEKTSIKSQNIAVPKEKKARRQKANFCHQEPKISYCLFHCI